VGVGYWRTSTAAVLNCGLGRAGVLVVMASEALR
jgi:hypothetical protein